MTHQRLALVLGFAAVLGAALGAPRSEAATSGASITNFTITVVDLDPNDGITAGFTGSNPFTRLFTQATFFPLGPGVQDEQVVPNWNPGLRSQSSFTQASADASTGPSFGWVSASGQSSEPSQIYTAQAEQFDNPFKILPNTRLTFTGDMAVSGAVDPCLGGASACQFGTSFVSFDLSPTDGSDESLHITLLRDFGGGNPNSVSGVEHIDASFSTSADEWTGAISASAQTYISVVPEPETYALMLVGLAALGLLRDRRRRFHQPHCHSAAGDR